MVNFVEEESDSTNAKQASYYPAFNKVIEEGIFVGRKCYKFFGEFYFHASFRDVTIGTRG